MLLTARLRAMRVLGAALWDRTPTWVSRLHFTVMPTDIDLNLHLTNSRYPQLMDAGRLDLLVRSGVFAPLLRAGGRPVAVELSLRFRRELRLGQRFELVTEACSAEGKAVRIEQRFMVGEVQHAVGTVTVLNVVGGRAADPGVLRSLLRSGEEA